MRSVKEIRAVEQVKGLIYPAGCNGGQEGRWYGLEP